MKKKIVGILVCTLLIAASTTLIGTTVADWDPDDGHKMHFPQMPDPNGWDVHATAPIELADDWRCSETGYVKDIHFWGSWLGDDKGVITSFNIAIYTNNPGPPSKPKDLKWEREIVDWVERDPDYGDQGWYWPENDEYLYHDHQLYYQYNVFLEEPWFLQEEGTIYWLVISANVARGTWGWKSSKNHYMDDAVWRAPGGNWKEMYEPEPPITNQFWLTMEQGEPVEAGGTDYFDDGTSFINGWYYYPYILEPWWYNIWFYNAPFSYDKYKEIYVSFNCDPGSGELIWFVINWATDIWSLEVQGRPPLPQDVEGEPAWEDMVIGRWPSPRQGFEVEPGFNEFYFKIPDYNPEWVSIDFMGWGSFTIVDGIIIHQCLPPAHAESLDLAFVITGEPEEEPCVDIEKKVKDSAGNWVEEIDATVCTNVEFKIDIHNCGNPDLTNIVVVDTLPSCLEYVSYTVEPSMLHAFGIVGNQLTWHFGSYSLKFCNTLTIKLKAHVISTGENVNEVTVTTDEGASDSDTATVNGIGTAVPKISCGGTLRWTSVKPGSTQTGTITVKNIGDPGSQLKWKVCSYPSWGTWSSSPSSGTGLTPAMGDLAITVTVVAPNQKNQQFTGPITLCNEEDSTDTCTIQVSLATPKSKPYINTPFLRFLENLLEQHPFLLPMLRCLLGL